MNLLKRSWEPQGSIDLSLRTACWSTALGTCSQWVQALLPWVGKAISLGLQISLLLTSNIFFPHNLCPWFYSFLKKKSVAMWWILGRRNVLSSNWEPLRIWQQKVEINCTFLIEVFYLFLIFFSIKNNLRRMDISVLKLRFLWSGNYKAYLKHLKYVVRTPVGLWGIFLLGCLNRKAAQVSRGLDDGKKW